MKLDKDDLKAPDTFVSSTDRLFQWVERHAASVGAVFGILIISAVGWVGYGYFQSYSEAKAAEALYGPESELRKAETAVRDDRAKKMQELAGMKAKDKAAAKPEQLRPADFAKDYAPAVEKVKAAIKQNGGTKAGLMSAMNLSTFLLQQKQYAEALEVLQLTSYKPSQGDILGGFWAMHRGLVLMENQKYDEAVSAYEGVVNSPKLAAFHPEAMLKLGLAFEMKGQADRAKQTYEKLGRDFPNSEASSSAQQYLRLLDLKPEQG